MGGVVAITVVMEWLIGDSTAVLFNCNILEYRSVVGIDKKAVAGFATIRSK